MPRTEEHSKKYIYEMAAHVKAIITAKERPTKYQMCTCVLKCSQALLSTFNKT